MLTRALTVLALLFLAVAPIEAAQGKKHKTTSNKTKYPTILIKTVHNHTPYNLMLVDRLARNVSAIIPSGEKVEVALTSNGMNKVVIQGSLSDVMAKKAQYVFIKLNEQGTPEMDQEVYLNIACTPGGVNDGSNFIVGTKGSTVLEFYVAGKRGGAQIWKGPLKNSHCKSVECDLNLYLPETATEEGVFRLTIENDVQEIV